MNFCYSGLKEAYKRGRCHLFTQTEARENGCTGFSKKAAVSGLLEEKVLRDGPNSTEDKKRRILTST